jgi:hypothetical protein
MINPFFLQQAIPSGLQHASNSLCGVTATKLPSFHKSPVTLQQLLLMRYNLQKQSKSMSLW